MAPPYAAFGPSPCLRWSTAPSDGPSEDAPAACLCAGRPRATHVLASSHEATRAKPVKRPREGERVLTAAAMANMARETIQMDLMSRTLLRCRTE